MLSHFDSDHTAKTIEIIENLKVKNIIISKQAERSNEFENIIKKAQENKINVILVKAGDIVRIDKDTYFEILWPQNDNIIAENALNNNSIVAKMYHKNFSILFTGDIEEKAEVKIVEKYQENLKASVLKVPHHGSSTSSTKEFIQMVKPQISLIGAGKNNKFGHPSIKTIETLESYGSTIYRTDLHGEITLVIDKKGEVKIDTHV